MADKVTVKFTAYGYRDFGPDDTADLEADDARTLVRAGVAVYATVPDAKAAGGDPQQAATKRKS